MRRLTCIATSICRVVHCVSSISGHLGHISLTRRCKVSDYHHDDSDDHAHYDNGDCRERDAFCERSLVYCFGLWGKVLCLLGSSRSDVCISSCLGVSLSLCFCCSSSVDFRLFRISYALVISDDESELRNSCAGLLAIESNEILVGCERKVCLRIASAWLHPKEVLSWCTIAARSEIEGMDYRRETLIRWCHDRCWFIVHSVLSCDLFIRAGCTVRTNPWSCHFTISCCVCVVHLEANKCKIVTAV